MAQNTDTGDGKKLTITIVPKIDTTSLLQAVRKALGQAGTVRSGGSGGSTVKKDAAKKADGSAQDKEKAQGGTTSQDSTARDSKRAQLTAKAIQATFNFAFTAIQKSFGIVQQIYSKIKQSSAFLQTVQNLFNLAMTLLLMPLGNALAEVILPAMTTLLENITGMWDEMDDLFDGTGSSLGDLMDYVLEQGIKYFAEAFDSIAAEFQKSDGLLGGIGNLMAVIGQFLRSDMVPVLTGIFSIVSTVLSHLKEFISLYVAMKTFEIGYTIGADMAGGLLGMLPGTKAVSGLAVASVSSVVAGATTYGILDAYLSKNNVGKYAEGGYVPATDGGHLAVVGEGGEGEYIIPESKMGSVGGSVTNNFYGYTTEQLKQLVREVLSDEISNSKYRSGY